MDGKIKFECQGSGKCCVSHGEHGFVFLTEQDTQRIEKFLNKNRDTFSQVSTFDFVKDDHTQQDQRHFIETGPACQFLENKRCSIYEARPTQCRTWPFWPENMNPKAWDYVAKFCPGVGKGREYSEEEIGKIIADQST